MIEYMSPIKGCLGCYKHNLKMCYMRVAYKGVDDDIHCPCIECLVKPMCSVTCIDLLEYTIDLYEAMYKQSKC